MSGASEDAGEARRAAAPSRRAARHGRDRRLPERRQVDADQPADRDARRGRPRDERHDARPQGARLRVGRQAVPADRHRRRRRRREGRDRPLDRRAGARSAIAEADLVLLPRRRARGRDAGRRGARDDPPQLAQAGARAREQDRRPVAGDARARVPPPRPRRPDPALRACTATTPATCSTRSSRGSRTSGEARPHVVGDEAIRVAILGRPNVGKSSLFNALIGAERTIVSEVPGTTRDAIDTVLERDGRMFLLIDTAGPAPQAQAAAGDRVLLGAARARGGRAGRRRARPDRRERGDRRGRPRRRRRRAEGAVLDARRARRSGTFRR